MTLGTPQPLVFIYSLALPQEEITIPNGHDDKDKDPFDTPPRKIKITELESNTDGTLIAGTKNSTDILEDYKEDVIAKLSQAAIKRLKSRSALKNPKNKDAPATGLSSPKFALGGTRNNGSTITTYAGDYRFLESQADFDSTFPTRTFEGAQAKTVKASIDRFIDECQYSAFTQLLRIDYIGSLDRVDICTISNITARIQWLHMTTRDDKASGGITSADNLFHQFLKLANLLPLDTTLWGSAWLTNSILPSRRNATATWKRAITFSFRTHPCCSQKPINSPPSAPCGSAHGMRSNVSTTCSSSRHASWRNTRRHRTRSHPPLHHRPTDHEQQQRARRLSHSSQRVDQRMQPHPPTQRKPSSRLLKLSSANTPCHQLGHRPNAHQ